MRRLLCLSVPLLLAGCASTATIPETRTDRSIVTVQTNAGSTDMQLTRDAAISSEVFAADADAVWAALPAVYATLEIPVDGIDTGAKLLSSNQRWRRVGGKGMSTYFNCPGAYGNVAASGDVFVTLRTQVLPGGESATTVRHQVEAVARSSTGAISQVRCTSRGSLENLLTETLRGMLPEG